MYEFSKGDTKICKGLAILIMIFHHMYMSAQRFKGYEISFAPFQQDAVVKVADFGKICVGMYVFISIYGLTKAYDRGKGRGEQRSEFVLARYLKMMVTYWAIYLLSVVATWPFPKFNVFHQYTREDAMSTAYYVLMDFLGIADWAGTRSLNGTWWYMSLASILICMIPLLSALYDKCGAIVVCTCLVVLPLFFGIEEYNYLVRWGIAITLGIWMAKRDLVSKLKIKVWNMNRAGQIMVFAMLCMVIWIMFKFRQDSEIRGEYLYIWESIAPVTVILLAILFVTRVPVIRWMLGSIGGYSTIIFLTHTFIRNRFAKDLIYGQSNFLMGYLILVGLSIALAIVLDLLFRAIQLPRLEKKLVSMVHRAYAPKSA